MKVFLKGAAVLLMLSYLPLQVIAVTEGFSRSGISSISYFVISLFMSIMVAFMLAPKKYKGVYSLITVASIVLGEIASVFLLTNMFKDVSIIIFIVSFSALSLLIGVISIYLSQVTNNSYYKSYVEYEYASEQKAIRPKETEGVDLSETICYSRDDNMSAEVTMDKDLDELISRRLAEIEQGSSGRVQVEVRRV